MLTSLAIRAPPFWGASQIGEMEHSGDIDATALADKQSVQDGTSRLGQFTEESKSYRASLVIGRLGK